MSRPIIYQVMTRLFGNSGRDKKSPKLSNQKGGELARNGVGKFADFSDEVLTSINRFGYSHIWYTGVLDHATQTAYPELNQPSDNPVVIKGVAGSPYAVRDYYNVCADLAQNPLNRMQEFEELVARTHAAQLKVIIDFVPNHVARNYRSVSAPDGVSDLGAEDRSDWHFYKDNNFYYCVNESFSPQFDRDDYVEYPAKVTGNDCFSANPSHNDWYETVKLNYGVDYCGGGAKHFSPKPNTWYKMLEILKFWASKGVDAFRCDMVEMVPVDFWHWAIAKLKAEYPNIEMIAEIYNPTNYRNYISYGGFDFLYDKVGLYDTLRNVVEAQAPASSITYAHQAIQDISGNMLAFMENHDEQRIASKFFADKPNLPQMENPAIRGWLATAVAVALARGGVMIYAGQEVGETGMDEEGFSGLDGRTTIFDYWRVASLQRIKAYFEGKKLTSKFERNLCNSYEQLLALANSDLLLNGELYDLMWLNLRNPEFDQFKQFAFLRHTDKEVLLCVANFDSQPKNISIQLSSHVFDALNMAQKPAVQSVDYFSGKQAMFSFVDTEMVNLEIEEYGFKAYKFSK